MHVLDLHARSNFVMEHPVSTQLFESMSTGYANLFSSMTVSPQRKGQVDAIAQKILAGRKRYDAVGLRTGVPWWWIGVVHNLEGGCDFSAYLGNGQSLARVTTEVPAGRGPFDTWEDGAVDALRYDGIVSVTDWTCPHALYLFEKWNGWDYVSKKCNSPYVWSFSNHYTQGKYVADGVWSSSAVSQQCGAAVILKCLMDGGHIPELAKKTAKAGLNAMENLEPYFDLIDKFAPTIGSLIAGQTGTQIAPLAVGALHALAGALGAADAQPGTIAGRIETMPTSGVVAGLQKAEAAVAAPLQQVSAPAAQRAPASAQTSVQDSVARAFTDAGVTNPTVVMLGSIAIAAGCSVLVNRGLVSTDLVQVVIGGAGALIASATAVWHSWRSNANTIAMTRAVA